MGEKRADVHTSMEIYTNDNPKTFSNKLGRIPLVAKVQSGSETYADITERTGADRK